MHTHKFKPDITLHTNYMNPSIPLREFDWMCIEDNYDGAPDSEGISTIMGIGATEQEAIDDWFEQYSDWIGADIKQVRSK